MIDSDRVFVNIRQAVIAEKGRSGACDAICLDRDQYRMLMIAIRNSENTAYFYDSSAPTNADFSIAGHRFVGRFEDVRIYVSDELPLGVIR